MIIASEETYDFFMNAFGRDSFDGAGAIMDSIFNRGYGCPNASWNGTFISFCPGLTTDDVTAHEWGHAYTQYTHNLIYAWQPGALNESYSDIWGETVDRINGRDDIDNSATIRSARAAATCTIHTQQPPVITINAPPAIAGTKPAGTRGLRPGDLQRDGRRGRRERWRRYGADPDRRLLRRPELRLRSEQLAERGRDRGKIALVDRGTCGFAIKAKNAQVNGRHRRHRRQQHDRASSTWLGVDPTVDRFRRSRSARPTERRSRHRCVPVNATLTRVAGTGTDASTRWLLGEDDTAVGLTGALRDMWNPPCYFNPGKVTDAFYGCGTADNGGVHNNSGVPNHAFALLVDGGTYNGQTITGIGLTKAAHIYFRAATVYQHSASDFADHADAIEQSART